jgi:hypothetical protein
MLAGTKNPSLQNDYKFDMNCLQLAFIGDANWDIYVDDKSGTLYSVAKAHKRGDNGRDMDSVYGDKHHIKELIRKGIFRSQPTEVGLSLLSGLHSVKYIPEKEKPFIGLYFNSKKETH